MLSIFIVFYVLWHGFEHVFLLSGFWDSDMTTDCGTHFHRNVGIYTGPLKCLKYHGIGTMEYDSGDCYVGEWSEGKQHGQGKLTFSDGRVQEGLFANGVFVDV